MIRTILSVALAAMLAGCATSEGPTAPAIPSGNEAPRLVLTVLTGTKAAPVDTPTVRIAWWHQDSVFVYAVGVLNKNDPSLWTPLTDDGTPHLTGDGADHEYIFRHGSGSLDVKVPCADSTAVHAGVGIVHGEPTAADSTWVYCK
jgi:hypothetical protein